MKINDEISSVSFNVLDTGNNLDKNRLLKIFKSLFKENDQIVFIGDCESDFMMDDNFIKKNRHDIPEYLNENGNYVELIRLDSSRFTIIGTLNYKFSIPDFFIQLWEYYRGLSFFILKPNISLQDLKNNKKIILDRDPYALKLFKINIFNFICIKGHDEDEFIVYYNNKFNDNMFNDILSLP